MAQQFLCSRGSAHVLPIGVTPSCLSRRGAAAMHASSETRRFWFQLSGPGRRSSRSGGTAKHASVKSAPAAPGDKLGLVTVDPGIEPYSEHLRSRFEQYKNIKQNIEEQEGSLADFAKGYEIFGFNREGSSTVYREWLPTAQEVHLIGDFNGWSMETPLQRGEYGVWSVHLPDDSDGKPAIAHGSRVKVKVTQHDGTAVDRVPAWIKVAQAPGGQMGAKFDGFHWSPPKDKQHQWRHARPAVPKSLRIYEAHVGMASEQEKVASYSEFTESVLPRIKAAGYTAVQLMAVQEHAYYASFGYHVTSPFAVSSRSGNPEDLKALVDAAHGLGLVVLLDVVHSHVSSNTDDGIAGFDFGQATEDSYFLTGAAGYHSQWDSRLFNYRNWETLRYLLSNLRWWLDEFRFDGFRFDGVTSMLYHHHGINHSFSGDYGEYFGDAANIDGIVYLMLANDMAREVLPEVLTIAEDVSGMPGLCRPVAEGGIGFGYRLAMGLPDFWVRLLKETPDENWSMEELIGVLCNRRYSEKTVAYVESHDQALVGDTTLAWRLMGAEMYNGMSTFEEASPVVRRGCALHCMVRALTAAIGGEAWLGFMGNEFGHPEWLDFPREGNEWSHQYCRRQWSLTDQGHLRYSQLAAFEQAMWKVDDTHRFISADHQNAYADNARQVLVAERGPLVWVFNFSPTETYEGFKVGVGEGGKYRVVLDSDDRAFGGEGRVGHDTDHFSQPEGIPGQSETNFNGRPHSMMVLSPPRTAVAYCRVNE